MPPSEPLGPEYAAYPRGDTLPPGSADQLKALRDGYFAVNLVFYVNVALILGLLWATDRFWERFRWVFPVGLAVLCLVIGSLSYSLLSKKIGYGANWNPGVAVLVALFMGMSSIGCCGLIGYVSLQSQAAAELRKYNLKSGVLGFRKKDVEALVAELRTQEDTGATSERSGDFARLS